MAELLKAITSRSTNKVFRSILCSFLTQCSFWNTLFCHPFAKSNFTFYRWKRKLNSIPVSAW